jgi:hypothetical protein
LREACCARSLQHQLPRSSSSASIIRTSTTSATPTIALCRRATRFPFEPALLRPAEGAVGWAITFSILSPSPIQ